MKQGHSFSFFQGNSQSTFVVTDNSGDILISERWYKGFCLQDLFNQQSSDISGYVSWSPILIHSGCYNKMPGTELLINNRSTFLSVVEAGQIRDITVRLWGSAHQDCRLRCFIVDYDGEQKGSS